MGWQPAQTRRSLLNNGYWGPRSYPGSPPAGDPTCSPGYGRRNAWKPDWGPSFFVFNPAMAGNSKSRTFPSQVKPGRSDADRRLRQADRLARVIRVLQLLLTRGRWNARDLAAEEEVSERTVFRDM